jgi:hypothetical protein
MPRQTEAVEQRFLRYRPLAHHLPVTAHLAKIKSDHRYHCKADFSKQSLRSDLAAPGVD